MTLLSAAMVLFLVMDPLGNIGFFLAALAGVPAERQRRVVVRELLIVLAALVAFLSVGRWALGLLHINCGGWRLETGGWGTVNHGGAQPAATLPLSAPSEKPRLGRRRGFFDGSGRSRSPGPPTRHRPAADPPPRPDLPCRHSFRRSRNGR
ncbi:MAG: MarC family protein [Longimicrobiales bacterium]